MFNEFKRVVLPDGTLLSSSIIHENTTRYWRTESMGTSVIPSNGFVREDNEQGTKMVFWESTNMVSLVSLGTERIESITEDLLRITCFYPTVDSSETTKKEKRNRKRFLGNRRGCVTNVDSRNGENTIYAREYALIVNIYKWMGSRRQRTKREIGKGFRGYQRRRHESSEQRERNR